MTKIWKQSLSLLLAAILVLALIPAMPLAAKAEEFTPGETWTIGDSYKSLIQGAFTPAGDDFVYEADEAFNWKSWIVTAQNVSGLQSKATLAYNGQSVVKTASGINATKGVNLQLWTPASFPEITAEMYGNFTLTVEIYYSGSVIATGVLNFVRNEPAPAVNYGASWEYLATYEWIQGNVATAEEDYIYEAGKAYDWAVTVSPTAASASVIVNATIVDAKGNVISSVTDKAVDCGKAPAVTTLLTAADFPELTGELLGNFKLEASVSIGTKSYAGVDFIFGRSGAYVEEVPEETVPEEPAEVVYGATFTPASGYEDKLNGTFNTAEEDYIYEGTEPFDWNVTVNNTYTKGIGVKVYATITTEKGQSVSKNKTMTLAVGENTVVDYTNFTELAADVYGNFQLEVTITAMVNNAEKAVAQLVAVFGRVEATEEPEAPAVPTKPGEVLWQYASSSEGEDYSWLNGAISTNNDTGIYKGWDPYDWAITLSPSKTGAAVTIEAKVEDHNGKVIAEKTKEVSVGKAPSVTTILTAGDLGLSTKTVGDFRVTAVIKYTDSETGNVASVAQVQAVFGRRIGDAGYTKAEYKSGNEWININFNDDVKSYVGTQPYAWTVSVAPSLQSATFDVTATVIDAQGEVVATLTKKDVSAAKTITTTVLTAKDLADLTADMYGTFAVTCVLSVGSTQYAGVYGVFERVEGEWVPPYDPAPVFTPEHFENCGLPQAIEVHNNGEKAKKVSVNITITKPDGTTTSISKTVDVAVGGSAVLANTNQLRTVITERGKEYTVTITGYWKNEDQQVDINETLTYVWAEHTDTEVVPGYAATCTEPGLTDGVYCHGCEGTITEQVEIEIDPEAHNFVDGTCACGATEAPERLDIRGVSRSKNLALEGTILVYANVAFMDSTATTNAEGLTKEYVMENGRLLFWSLADMPADAEAAVLGTETHCAEFDKTSVYKGIQEYYAYSHGIPAKEYNDTIYYRTYIVVDGVEYYGDIIEYSVVTYCENQLKKTTASANKMKPLLAAMLNYGAAAQEYFTYKTDAKANACLQTYVDQGLLDAAHLTLNWSDSYLTALVEADAAMTVNFAVNEAKRTSKNLGLEGAVETKLTFAYKLNGNVGSMMPADGNVTFYYWTAGTYNALKAAGKVLTKDNADYIKTGDEITQTYSTKYGYEYYAMSNGIPAKQLGETIYTAAVFTMADGTEYCSGVTVYSAEEYASGQISKASAAANLKTLAKWMVCYGEAAYTYFNG